MGLFQRFFLIVSLFFLVVQRTSSSQDLANGYVGLGQLPAGTAQSLRACGTPDKQVFQMQMVDGEEMVDGDLLRVDQLSHFFPASCFRSFFFLLDRLVLFSSGPPS
jgi:hypothetical protein